MGKDPFDHPPDAWISIWNSPANMAIAKNSKYLNSQIWREIWCKLVQKINEIKQVECLLKIGHLFKNALTASLV